VYRMYPWDGSGASEEDAPARPAETTGGAGPDNPGQPPMHELSAALQFALDRRDNGGDPVYPATPRRRQ
jgi:hypothetical protein